MEIDKTLLLELQVMSGRMHALVTFCAVMAGSLPQQVAATTLKELGEAQERNMADALALPFPDATIQAMQETIRTFQVMLGQTADQNHQSPGAPPRPERP